MQWGYAISIEKTFLKAPASSSSTCFSAFTAVVCCTSSFAFVLNDLQHLLGTCLITITLLMVFNAWCPNQNVNLDTCKVWLVMCLSNLLLEHFFLLEKDWLSLLEIRLFLKKWEAVTFTLASKVWSSSVQLVSKLSLRCASGFR